MACKGCERRRQAMKQMMEAGMAHASRLLAIRRGGDQGAKATADVQSREGSSADPQAKGSRQAGKAGTAHRKRSVAKPAGAGAGKGRVSVPRVRESGDGEAGAR